MVLQAGTFVSEVGVAAGVPKSLRAPQLGFSCVAAAIAASTCSGKLLA